MGFIYKVTCKVNNKIYIGKTERTISIRWQQHCRSSFLESDGDYNFPFHRAIRKYGKENFIIEEVEKIEDPKELTEREKYWINYYNSYDEGYNASLGGDGHRKYDYEKIVDFYLSHENSLLDTCKHFGIYDQVVYTALASKNINYKNLPKKSRGKQKRKKILCVELNKIFNSMKEIDEFLGKSAHPNVRRCLNGVTKKAYSYTWREIEDE